MLNQSPSTCRQRGAGLLEVLVTLIIIAVGMLGMAKMHTLILRDGGTANNRSVAASLAQEKLDDLRGFKWIDDQTGTGADNCTTTTNVFCYKEIAANAGGAENGAHLVISNGNVTIGNTTFNLSWSVADYVYCVGSTTASVNGVSCTKTIPDFKLVTVTVNWTDQNGAGSVALTSAIPKDDATIIAFGAAGPFDRDGPKVGYTPIGVPDVVPIDVDTNLQKETSKPLPDVSSKGYSVRTEFDTVTYSGTAGDYEQEQADEYATVSCTCEFTTSGPAYPASYFIWKDDKLQVKYPATAIDKVRGVAPAISGDTQDPLCEECCRDHHDSELPGTSSPTTALFDPTRPAGDYYSGSGNHKHYYYSNTSNPQQGLVEVAESSGNRYLESCRFLRVNGIFRLMQDWRLVDVTVMPKDGYLVDGSTALSDYQTYVGTVAKAQAQTDGDSTTSWNKFGLTVSRDTTNAASGSYIQYLARGIYVDRVYTEASPRTLDSTYYTDLITDISATDILKRIPFNEVNLTLLASWSADDTSVATISNETILDINSSVTDYYGVYSRGLVNVQTGTGNNTDITAYVLPSNSGLTGGSTRATFSGTEDYDASTLADTGTAIPYASEIGIDRHDHASSLRKSDTANISRAGSSSTSLVTGTLKQGNSSATFTETAISISGSGGVTCSDSITGTTGTFSCSVTSGYSGTITISSSQSGNFFDMAPDSNGDNRYNDGGQADGFSATCTVSNVTAPVTCGNFWVFGPSITVSGTCSDGGLGASLCGDAKVVMNADGTTPSGADVANCTKGTTPSCTSLTLDTGTRTWTGRFGVTSTQTGASGKPSHWDGDSTCSDGANTANDVRYTSSITAGPADLQAAFVMCVSDN